MASRSPPCSSPGASLEEVVRGLRERLRQVEEENSILQVNTVEAWQDCLFSVSLYCYCWPVLGFLVPVSLAS